MIRPIVYFAHLQFLRKRCCDPTFRFDFGSVSLRFDFNRKA
jgi:hypothetical protein